MIQRAALGANSQMATIPIRNFLLSMTRRRPPRTLTYIRMPKAASPAPKFRKSIHLGTMTALRAPGITRTAPGPFVGCKTVAFRNNRSLRHLAQTCQTRDIPSDVSRFIACRSKGMPINVLWNAPHRQRTLPDCEIRLIEPLTYCHL